MRNGTATISERLNFALFCAHYGWTYSQVISEPQWFIALLMMKLDEDSKFQQSKKRQK